MATARADAQAAALQAEAAAVLAREEAVRAREEASRAGAANQQVVERLHAALRASYAAALHLGDQRDAAGDQRDAAQAALVEIAAHAEAITKRSRAWRLVRMFGGLRRRIEMIAEAARAPRE
jgi:hypothetical protein